MHPLWTTELSAIREIIMDDLFTKKVERRQQRDGGHSLSLLVLVLFSGYCTCSSFPSAGLSAGPHGRGVTWPTVITIMAVTAFKIGAWFTTRGYLADLMGATARQKE